MSIVCCVIIINPFSPKSEPPFIFFFNFIIFSHIHTHTMEEVDTTTIVTYSFKNIDLSGNKNKVRIHVIVETRQNFVEDDDEIIIKEWFIAKEIAEKLLIRSPDYIRRLLNEFDMGKWTTNNSFILHK